MATKSITITEDAYERLSKHKGSKDSFSDVITRLAGKSSLKDLIGLVSEDMAKELESNIADSRKRMREDMERRKL